MTLAGRTLDAPGAALRVCPPQDAPRFALQAAEQGTGRSRRQRSAAALPEQRSRGGRDVGCMPLLARAYMLGLNLLVSGATQSYAISFGRPNLVFVRIFCGT